MFVMAFVPAERSMRRKTMKLLMWIAEWITRIWICLMILAMVLIMLPFAALEAILTVPRERRDYWDEHL